MANEKAQNVQDVFLNHVRKQKTPVTVFLVNGVKLQGIITWFDNFSVLLRRDGHTQLVYKHAISTVMPGAPIQLFDAAKAEGAASAGAGDDTCRRRVTAVQLPERMNGAGAAPVAGGGDVAVGSRATAIAGRPLRRAPFGRASAGRGGRAGRLDRLGGGAYRDPAVARASAGDAAGRGAGGDAGPGASPSRA